MIVWFVKVFKNIVYGMISEDKFLDNLRLLDNYLDRSYNYSDFLFINNLDVIKIIGLGFKYVTRLDYSYMYYYINFGKVMYYLYIYKISDDYYFLNIQSSFYVVYDYKLDQIRGLLKFLKILFRE